MKIADIKKEMLKWEDFYGGDISATDRIKSAKTKKQLAQILVDHEDFMEMMLCDAKSHIEEFRKKLGISLY